MAVAQLEPVFRYDADSHRYFIDGVEVPSVTRVLEPLSPFSGPPSEAAMAAAARGTAIHEICAMAALGDLAEWTVDDEFQPHLENWRRCLEETGAKVLEVEKAGWHPNLRFAGRADYVVEQDGKLAIWDIKTGASVGPMAGVQLAGYATLFDMDRKVGRYVIHLRRENYRVIPYTGADDYIEFRSLLNHYWWRFNHGQL